MNAFHVPSLSLPYVYMFAVDQKYVTLCISTGLLDCCSTVQHYALLLF